MKGSRGREGAELLGAGVPPSRRCLHVPVTLARSHLRAGCPGVTASLTPTVLHWPKSGAKLAKNCRPSANEAFVPPC